MEKLRTNLAMLLTSCCPVSRQGTVFLRVVQKLYSKQTGIIQVLLLQLTVYKDENTNPPTLILRPMISVWKLMQAEREVLILLIALLCLAY